MIVVWVVTVGAIVVVIVIVRTLIVIIIIMRPIIGPILHWKLMHRLEF